jgi:hypothetical protein
MAVMAFALTLGLASMASAATITCGGCHGTAPNGNPVNGDNCTNTARGLHGMHVNYSSLTYKKTVASNGKCAYCHAAVSDAKGIASRTHNNNFINVTGNTNAVGALNTLTMSYNSASKTCTNVCHKNKDNGSAKWGNYTATTVGNIKLSCRSCHDDIVDKAGLSGKHSTHLLANTTTAAGVLMSSANNAGCVACHPNVVTDIFSGGKADDGTKKAYPHATDGTNVVADNAVLNGQITGSTKAGLNTTCTNTCHPRSAAITWNTAWAQGAGTGCDMCHYWAAATLDTSNTGTGSLSSGHNFHFKSPNNFACTNCHPDHGTTYDYHGAKLPAQAYNVKVVRAGMTYTAATKTCSNTGLGCHGSYTTEAWSLGVPTGCAACHTYPGVAGRDWATVGNGHLVRYAASAATNTHLRDNASYNNLTDTYASVTASTSKCGLCHPASGVHYNGTTDVAGSGNGQCGGNFTVTVTTSGSNVTCGSVKCHNGKTTPNWW